MVAPYDRYAEALVGAAATRGDGPLLLSTPDGLHPAAAAEVQRLAPAEVLVVGDEEALGDAVLDDLRALGVEPERVGSADGTVFGIAAALAERGRPARTRTWSRARTPTRSAAGPTRWRSPAWRPRPATPCC